MKIKIKNLYNQMVPVRAKYVNRALILMENLECDVMELNNKTIIIPHNKLRFPTMSIDVDDPTVLSGKDKLLYFYIKKPRENKQMNLF